MFKSVKLDRIDIQIFYSFVQFISTTFLQTNFCQRLCYWRYFDLSVFFISLLVYNAWSDIVFKGNQLIMNNTQCPNCNQTYSFSNPPKRLKNCNHSICDTCLTTAQKCNIDNKKIEYRRYTAKAFEINNQLLDQLSKQNESPKKHKMAFSKQSSPSHNQKRDYQICLLHSKPADIICYADGNLICANCALFGEHRGHAIKNCEQFLNGLTVYTEQALEVFDKLKEKEQNLNEQVISEYIDDCFKGQKNQQIKNIKQAFTKLTQKIKKAEKAALSRLDNQIKLRKQYLMKEVSINQLESKKNEWYKEVETLGNITQGAYQFRNISDALRYLDQKQSESFLLKRGEYLFLQYSSSENVIKNKIDTQTAKLTTVVSQDIDKSIEDYCTFAGSFEKRESSPRTKLKQSNISAIQKKHEDDILIDQGASKLDFSDAEFRKQSFLRPQIQNRSGYVIGIKIPEVTIAESVQHLQQNTVKQNQRTMQRSKSSRQKSVTDFNTYSNREILGAVDNRKKRKIDIPDKYKQVFEDLKNDRCEVIDFGGAELGDQNILGLCQYIQKTNKLRNLKLVRNKISDDVVKQILNACFCAKVTSLNLGQNLLTEKSLQMFQTFDLGELRNITLSLNKINRRNVKNRLDDFVKRGITLSI